MGADRLDLPRLLPPASGPNTTSNSSRNAPLSPRPPRSSSSGASRHEPPGAAAGAARHPRHDGSAVVGTTAFGTRSPRSRRLPEAKVVPDRQAQGAARGSSCKPTQTHRGATMARHLETGFWGAPRNRVLGRILGSGLRKQVGKRVFIYPPPGLLHVLRARRTPPSQGAEGRRDPT